jgi:localization factor PodJL
MQQLEKSIGTLREMATHVASNETVSDLSGQVQALADKIDHLAIGGGAGAALNKLELRIDALSRAMTDRAADGDGVSPRLEAMLQSLSGKIDQLQQSRGDQTALNHLEDRIAKLVERLDATGSRLNQLDAVERGVTDLLVHIEDIRANKESTALRADSAPDIDVLKQNMANTQDTLEAVQGTLDRVADRLTLIEKDIREDRPAAREPDILELTTPAENAPAELVAPPMTAVSVMPQAITPEPVSAQASEPAQSLSSQFTNLGQQPAMQIIVNRDLAGDQPIEPGFGRPNFGTDPASRIAASEAALGNALPSPTSAGGKSNFIAAARRAAQAAGKDPKSRQARLETFKSSSGQKAPVRNKTMTRVKSLFLAASIVAIIIGSIHYASRIFNFGIFDTIDAKFAASPETDTANSNAASDAADPETSTAFADGQSAPVNTPAAAADADATASLLAPQTLPILTPAAPPQSVTTSTPLQPPLNLLEAAKGLSGANSPQLNAPLLGVPSVAKNDVTGSIARAPADVRAARQPAMQAPVADGLPVAIGSARLRNAATSGDPAAAYEVGMRFMEGRGVPANLEEAARWYERAAIKGLVPAQFRYASMLEKGQGVKKDLTAAHKLYVAAASKGHAKAMHNLAVIYAEGAEGKPDYANAAQWFRKAAEHGVADSQYNLAVLAARGLGTEKNIAEAYKWFALAAAQGDRDAGRKRDELAAHLDAQTLATLQEAVKNFVVQKQPAEAIVAEPPGAWDRGTAASPERPRAAGAPASGAFNSGKL